MKIYTDGSTLNNQKERFRHSGCAFCVIDKEDNLIYQFNRALKNVTNNVAELMALLYSLLWVNKNRERIKEPLEFYIDSQYVLNMIVKRYNPTANTKIIEKIIKEYEKAKFTINITFNHIRGHSKNKYNDLVDKLAKEASIRSLENALKIAKRKARKEREEK